jgi:hypothetical protein
MNFLTGKKTYIAALGLFLLGVVDIVNGDSPSGVQKIVEALGFAGLRSGISNSK